MGEEGSGLGGEIMEIWKTQHRRFIYLTQQSLNIFVDSKKGQFIDFLNAISFAGRPNFIPVNKIGNKWAQRQNYHTQNTDLR